MYIYIQQDRDDWATLNAKILFATVCLWPRQKENSFDGFELLLYSFGWIDKSMIRNRHVLYCSPNWSLSFIDIFFDVLDNKISAHFSKEIWRLFTFICLLISYWSVIALFSFFFFAVHISKVLYHLYIHIFNLSFDRFY